MNENQRRSHKDRVQKVFEPRELHDAAYDVLCAAGVWETIFDAKAIYDRWKATTAEKAKFNPDPEIDRRDKIPSVALLQMNLILNELLDEIYEYSNKWVLMSEGAKNVNVRTPVDVIGETHQALKAAIATFQSIQFDIQETTAKKRREDFRFALTLSISIFSVVLSLYCLYKVST